MLLWNKPSGVLGQMCAYRGEACGQSHWHQALYQWSNLLAVAVKRHCAVLGVPVLLWTMSSVVQTAHPNTHHKCQVSYWKMQHKLQCIKTLWGGLWASNTCISSSNCSLDNCKHQKVHRPWVLVQDQPAPKWQVQVGQWMYILTILKVRFWDMPVQDLTFYWW